MAEAKPTGEQELEAQRDEDTVDYDLNERTRHELIRGTFTNILTLIKIGFWVRVGFCLAGMVFCLLACDADPLEDPRVHDPVEPLELGSWSTSSTVSATGFVWNCVTG